MTLNDLKSLKNMFVIKEKTQGPRGGGVLRLVNDGDDRRIFLGWKIWQVYIWVT